MDAERFKQRLAETIAWCLLKAPPVDPREGLRSEALKPVLIHDRELPPGQKPDARNGQTWFQFLMGAGERSWNDVVADLAARRAEELLKARPGFKDNLPDLAQGHLLFFEDDLSELSGSSETASQGFINARDVAPWDSWVGFIPKSPVQPSALLISWVPPAFLELVEAGIAANETDCLWLTPCSPDLPALLVKRETHYRTLERDEE